MASHLQKANLWASWYLSAIYSLLAFQRQVTPFQAEAWIMQVGYSHFCKGHLESECKDAWRDVSTLVCNSSYIQPISHQQLIRQLCKAADQSTVKADTLYEGVMHVAEDFCEALM